jgi:hypothetical protein
MASQQSKVFLTKITTAIKKGDYDKKLTVPFMTQDLLISAIKAKVNAKESKGSNPILTDTEIKECINDAKETAAYTAIILYQYGILSKDDKDKIELSNLGKIALKQTSFNLSSN